MLLQDKVFVLKKVAYGEADLILQCLNSKGAKVSFFARAALKSRKRFGGILEPTHYLQVMYQQRSGVQEESVLFSLREASLLADFGGIRSDYNRLECGLHMVSLMAAVSREGEVHSIDLFHLLGNSLQALEISQDIAKLRTHFESKLLAYQGVWAAETLEEQSLLRSPIAAHDKLEVSSAAWKNIAYRVQRVLKEYTGH